MAEFAGFIGPSYAGKSKYAAIEKCLNFYPEVLGTPSPEKAKVVLYPTPGTGYVSGGSDFPQPNRGLLQLNGRIFGVNGSTFFEFILPTPSFPSGAWYNWGAVADDGLPVCMVANGVITTEQQIFISSAGQGYVWSLGNVFSDLSLEPQFLAGTGAAFINGYFASIIDGTNGFQISNVNSGALGNWDSLDVAYAQGQSDTLVNLISDHGYLWLFGNRHIQLWYAVQNPGPLDFPFAPQQGAFIEIGLEAATSLTKADNSLFWLGASSQGGRIAYRTSGINPVRISNHAIEQEWAKYSTVADTWTYSFEWDGHTFVRFIFPTAGKGWTYDCAASADLGMPIWHENAFTQANGVLTAPLERGYCFLNGVHYVGGGAVTGHPGAIYKFTTATYIPEDPVAILLWSNDGGNTWGPEYEVPVGNQGEYVYRVQANLLGSGRDRVFWLRCIDKGECALTSTTAEGEFYITRDRICPHLYHEYNLNTYHQLEIECQRGIGSANGEVDKFWALISAYLYFSPGAA